MSGWTLDDLKARGIGEDGKRIPKEEVVPTKLKHLATKKPKKVVEEAPPFDINTFDLKLPTKLIWSCFIPHNVASKKNSKRIGTNFKTKKPIIINSKLVEKYIKTTTPLYRKLTAEFKLQTATLEKPIRVGFLFHRQRKNSSDFNNLTQVVTDIMTALKWITDDNMDEILPFPMGNGYIYDKNNAGLTLAILI